MALTTSAQQILTRSVHLERPADIPEKFWELVDRYRGELLNQALAITGSFDDAEDVVQETFCEAFRDHQKLSQVRSFRAWLRTVNKTNALNRVRSKKHDSKRIDRKQLLAPEANVTTGGFTTLEVSDMVAKAIEGLSADQRTVVIMHFYEHLTHDQIAERTQISARTVRRLLYDASLMLHNKLKVHLAPGQENSASDQTDQASPSEDNGEQE